jgi:hypothetical protein
MPDDVTFATFEKELNRLVESFGRRLNELQSADYNEAKLRDDFLNPFFRALGWDMENRAGLIQKEREVEIESATQIGGGRKRADYLFRTHPRDQFICEAKKAAEELNARYAFQTKRYAYNKGVWVGILTDFEELKIFIVGSKPHLDEPQVGEWKSWHFRQYPLLARELWDLLARDSIAAGSIDRVIDALPKKAAGTGKARQQWLIKPDRTRALDNDFLGFLDATRRDLASDIYKNNGHENRFEANRLTEAVQRIIDRILFLRICEDRDIDTGTTLQSIVEIWRKNTGHDETGRRAHQQPLEMHDTPPAGENDGLRVPKDSLWRRVVEHFRALDRRPPTHVPFFNGNLFKPHFTETLVISDEWLAGFIGELSDDETPISSVKSPWKSSAASMNASSARSSGRRGAASPSRKNPRSAKPVAFITPRATSSITSSSRPPENCWMKLRAERPPPARPERIRCPPLRAGGRRSGISSSRPTPCVCWTPPAAPARSSSVPSSACANTGKNGSPPTCVAAGVRRLKLNPGPGKVRSL